MKKWTFLFLLAFISGIVAAQNWQEKFYSSENKEKTATTNFYDIQKSFNDYWESYDVKGGYYYKDGKKYKASGWKQFKRWEWFWETRINRETGEFPAINTFELQHKVYNKKSSKADLSDWESMGPSSSSGGYAGIGRINCITFHPTNDDIIWIGAPSGGIWKTTDGGGTWEVLNDNLSVIGVSEIVLANDYETSKTIYIATGDRDGGDNYSIGVLKSTDDGETWNTTGLSFDVSYRYRITRMLMHPDNSNIIYVSTNGGVFKTIDGGENWTSQMTDKIFFDMEFKPNCEDTVLYLASYSYYNSPEIYKTSNAGISWDSTYAFPASATRVELDVAKSDSSVLYAMASTTSGGLEGVYRSDNSGLSFTKVYDGTAANANLLNWTVNDTEDDKSGQGSYDLTLSVSPTNKNVVYLGGINTWKSVDGGNNWTASNVWTSYSDYNPGSKPVVHADKHYMEYQNNSTFFEANDGGIYKTTDGGNNWVDLSNNLVISQIYKLGVSATVKDEVITGLQDNGTKLLSSGDWKDVKGGDGMECLIDYTDVNVQYATYAYGQIDRTTAHWNNWQLTIDITDTSRIEGGANGAWVTPYVIDPFNNQTLYLGYEDIWKSTNRGNSWTKISNLNLSNKIRAIAIAPNDNNTIYFTDYDGFFRTTNGGGAWTDLTASLPNIVGGPAITHIAVDAFDSEVLWITFGGYGGEKVFESTNGGSTWTDISTGLPSVPANCIIQNKHSQEKQLYAATDLGVYLKEGDDNWALFSNNLPSVVVTEMEIYYDNTAPQNSILYAGTYGRGLWKTTVAPYTYVAGIDEDLERMGIKIYPNPTEDKLTIESNGQFQIDKFSIFDMSGREIYHKDVNNQNINTIDLRDQAKGMYIVKLVINGNNFSTKVLLK